MSQPKSPSPPPERAEPPATSTVRVTFTEGEEVSRFGTVRTTYRVLCDRVWLRPNRIANARVSMLSPSPGILWQSHTAVDLPLGTQVERVTVSPERKSASAGAILLGTAKGLSQKTRTLSFRVGPKGLLVPA